MKNNANKKVVSILLLLFLLLAAALFSLLQNRTSHSQQQHLERTTTRYTLAYKTIYAQHKQLATSISSGFIVNFDIVALYKELATANETEKEKLREKLLMAIMPRYQALKQTTQLNQLHFHLPDNESFLRFHRPERYGDNLSAVRRTVAYVNREHTAIDGFEEGRIYAGYRFVFPLTAPDNTHLGSMEVSFGPEAFTAAMMQQYNVLSNFFVRAAGTKQTVFSDELNKNYKESHHPGYYYDKRVLQALKKVSERGMKSLKPQKSITDQIYADAHTKQPASVYDPSIDMVFTTIPVVHPLTQEMIAFLTVRSRDPIFGQLTKQLYTTYGLCLFLLASTLFTFYLQLSKRKQLVATHERAELKIMEAKEEAEAANLAKSVFLANMSHELRTPLNAILGYTQIFAGDVSLDSRQQRGIQTIHQSGEHLLMLINDILDLSKIEAEKMQLVPTEFGLSHFVEGVSAIIKVKARSKKIDFSHEMAADLPAGIEADEVRLRQILLNLLSNAVKFTERGSCHFSVQAKRLEHNSKSMELHFAVTDSGPGISQDKRDSVFQPFQQTGERLLYSEGSGLGLAISRKLVHLMGGEIELLTPVNNHPAEGEGPGCCFSFRIVVPVTANTPAPAAKAQTVIGYCVNGVKQSGKKILIVDDNGSNRAVLKDTLIPLGFNIFEAVDGSEVLHACEQYLPDAILMDLRMPEMDGLEATRQLQTHPPFADIPVLAITASATDQEKLRKRCQEHGFAAYISKPYTIMELLNGLAEQLHIELQYAGDVSEEISPSRNSCVVEAPSPATLAQLMESLEIGDLDGLIAQLQAVEAAKPGKYTSFITLATHMAQEFQLSELEGLIKGK